MLAVLFGLTSFLLSNSTDWTWNVYPESGFKILSPVELTHQVIAVPTTADVIQFHQYSGGSIADAAFPMAFVIDHYRMPQQDDASDPEYLRDFFENTIDQILISLEGTLIYMDIIAQGGQDVCVWKATFQQGGGLIRGHCILAGEHYYGLQAFGLTKNKPDAAMSKFLDSFKRTDPTSP